MATEIGAKSSGTGCWDCFRPKSKPDMDRSTPTPEPLVYAARRYTPKEIQEFKNIVKADETDEAHYEAKEPSEALDEILATANMFKKIYPNQTSGVKE